MNDWLHKEMSKVAEAQKTGSFYTNILSSSCYVQPSMTRWIEVRNKVLSHVDKVMRVHLVPFVMTAMGEWLPCTVWKCILNPMTLSCDNMHKVCLHAPL